ncbi:uncharacterized protein LOC131978127 isoform X2 [Centropristis striata]|uniref:uncharacterized protein LOC131978127 isoform X2 n=1 Tax=Centropristis striata TaxID=184440 RepID=UPI0027E1F532|nr:uncharacterized protein LOC131978127 isoform X2 [Centropristis striata]
MNQKMIFKKLSALLSIALLLPEMILSAATGSDLTCDVTRLADGFGFLYQLSRPLQSPQCSTCWEDLNNNVIARDSNFNGTLVNNLTESSITMKSCWDYLHFIKDNLQCSGSWEEAHCRVNCTLLQEEDPPLSTVIPTHRTCLSESWCPPTLNVCLVIIFVLLLIAGIFFALYLWRRFKLKREESAAGTVAYSHPEQIRVETGDVGDQRKDILR